MSRALRFFLLALSLASAAWAQPKSVLLKNVTVIDGTGKAPFRASLLLSAGRIQSVIPAGQTYPGGPEIEVIDGSGKFAMPGLVDLLTHISFRSAIDPETPYKLSPLFDDILQRPETERRQIYEEILKFSLRRGVTTFVDSISSVRDLHELAGELDSTHFPNFHSLGPILSPREGHPFVLDGTDWKYEIPAGKPSPEQLTHLEGDLESLFQRFPLAGLKIAVDGPAEEGHAGPSVDESVIRAVVKVAGNHGKPVFFLSMTDEGIQKAARAGAAVKLGPPIVLGNPNMAPREETWRALVDNHVSLLSITANWGGNLWRYMQDGSSPAPSRMPLIAAPDSYFRRLPEPVRRNYENYLKRYQTGDAATKRWVEGAGKRLCEKALTTLKEAHERSVPILPTADSGSFWVFQGNLWMELDNLKPVLEPLDLISAVTLQAAKTVHLDREVGSLEVGKLADILVLNQDPTKDITHVRDVAFVLKSGERVAE